MHRGGDEAKLYNISINSKIVHWCDEVSRNVIHSTMKWALALSLSLSIVSFHKHISPTQYNILLIFGKDFQFKYNAWHFPHKCSSWFFFHFNSLYLSCYSDRNLLVFHDYVISYCELALHLCDIQVSKWEKRLSDWTYFAMISFHIWMFRINSYFLIKNLFESYIFCTVATGKSHCAFEIWFKNVMIQFVFFCCQAQIRHIFFAWKWCN